MPGHAKRIVEHLNQGKNRMKKLLKIAVSSLLIINSSAFAETENLVKMVPEDCFADIESQDYCLQYQDSGLLGKTVKMQAYLKLYKFDYADAQSIKDSYLQFSDWADKSNALEKDTVNFKFSYRLPEVVRDDITFIPSYMSYVSQAPAIIGGKLDVIGVSLTGEVAPWDIDVNGELVKADASMIYYLDNEAWENLPDGSNLAKPKGIVSHKGSLHVVSCEHTDICDVDSEWMIIYTAEVIPEVKIGSNLAAPFVSATVQHILEGLFLNY